MSELLIGKARPTAGAVRLGGVDPVTARDAFSQRVGVLFAEDSLYKYRSPLANLHFDCRLHGLPKSRAVKTLNEIGLADCADAPPV